jgi:hypothetical protein
MFLILALMLPIFILPAIVWMVGASQIDPRQKTILTFFRTGSAIEEPLRNPASSLDGAERGGKKILI